MLKNSHFDVSAAVIKQLGAELISDEVTAIMELIKNSYDADADWVRISITTTSTTDSGHYFKRANGLVVIEDNGFGMDENDIRDGWLIVSVSKKREDKLKGKTTPAGRTPLGDKGVGRLSVQRLGNKFEMITGKKRNDFFTQIAFDWNDFVDNVPLSKVKLHSARIQKSYNKEGTTLIISDLIDPNKWNGQSWAAFRGHLSQLIFPHKESRIFEVYLNKDGESIDLDAINENIRDLAVSEHIFNFTGSKLIINSIVSFDKLSGNTKDQDFIEDNILPDEGRDFYNFLIDHVSNKNSLAGTKFLGKRRQLFQVEKVFDLESIDKLIYVDQHGNEVDASKTDVDREFAQPGPFSGEIRDFYFKETEQLSNTFDSLGEFKKLVQNQAGIRIFRDGFGLRPYGLDGNDWLKLGGSQTSGASFYGLRPGNVVGFISIGAKSNKNLKEKTDREGFVASPFSLNFFTLTDKVRHEINDTLTQTRRSFNEYKARKIAEQQGFEGVKDSFAQLTATSKSAGSLIERAKSLEKQIDETAVVIKHEYTRIQPIKDIDRKIYSDTKSFLDHVDDLLSRTNVLIAQIQGVLKDAKKLDGHVKYLEPIISDLESQLRDFSQLAGLGLTAEALSHELSNIIDRINQQTDRIAKDYNRDPKRAGEILLVFIETIKTSIRSFRKQLSHLAPSLKFVRENRDTFSVEKFCRETVEFYSERFGDQIQIRFKLSGGDFKVHTNKGRITQVMDNLILNSEYWVRERSKIEKGFRGAIDIEAKEPYLYVRDNGYGVEVLIEDRLFQPFVTSKPRNEGRGLGLFIVQQLMEAIGGSVTLLSKRNANGRRYIFQIDLTKVIN